MFRGERVKELSFKGNCGAGAQEGIPVHRAVPVHVDLAVAAVPAHARDITVRAARAGTKSDLVSVQVACVKIIALILGGNEVSQAQEQAFRESGALDSLFVTVVGRETLVFLVGFDSGTETDAVG